MPVYTLPEWLLGFLVFGSIGLLALYVVLILFIFVREIRGRRLW